MRSLKVKTITLIFFILVILINAGLVFSYYNFYLSDKISSDIISAKDENHKILREILINIQGEEFNDGVKIIKEYVKQHGGYVSLISKNKGIIYTNKIGINKIFSSSVTFFSNNEEYELIYSKISKIPGIENIKKFILYEILIISLICITIYFISSKQIIDPIDSITKDINDYKYGVIPKKKELPNNMKKIQNEFVDLVDTLEVEKENQSRIIASISHDIKTPLTSIMGYTDRLKNSNLSDDKKKQYIDTIYKKAYLMKQILEEFDDYQSCNIKDTLKLKDMKIKDITNFINNDFSDDLKEKNIKLTIKSSCDDTIYIDELKIKRVFSNIISNSVTHFNNRKGIINIKISKDKDKHVFEIEDNAGGIQSEKELKKIFEPLYTTDKSRRIYGLGLSICKQIISAHNGFIYAKNNDINGLSIIFII